MSKRFTAGSQWSRQRESGVALIIVLAFVVILTGVIVAYFSRSLASRQISDSSASETKVSLFAQGAADAIIGNLQQEIALTSSATTISTGSATTMVYTPLTPSSMLPQMSGTVAPGVSTWAPNFLIRSAYSQNFYTGTSSAATIPGGAALVSSTTPSLNGRYVSLSRWNDHYLLPLASGTNVPMPDVTQFAPPDWVVVARDGSNPTAWNSNMTAASTNSTTVVGRYAYAIYHEGGLLDANVAGSPIGTGSAAVISNATYKPALAYADLTQIPGLSATTSDAIVGWRNYASAQVPGTYLAPGFGAASGSAYYNFVAANPSGFLMVTGTSLNGNGAAGQSDRMFGSRQELIAFMQKGLGLSGTSLNALNYLTTFSRDLNQPSLAPLPTPAPGASPDATHRPAIVDGTSGGNNAYGLDSQINPSFLTDARVSGTGGWLRNDGTVAVAGEPLVKKRFALNRLAWITCLGPSGENMKASVVQQTITALGGNPSNPSDPVYQFVNLGTRQNIYNYFGLSWVPDGNGVDLWFYSHDGTAPISAAPATGNSIRKLASDTADTTPNTVLAANREADFVELLKAAINAGSLAKGATNPKGTPMEVASFNSDTSLDYHILQITANIIEQFKPDGYPVRIRFAPPTTPLKIVEFRGTESLPYFYRMRESFIVAGFPNIMPLSEGSVDAYNPAQPLTTTGLLVSLDQPEIWNPHDINGSVGSPRPTKLRFLADTNAIDVDGNGIGNWNSVYGTIFANGTTSTYNLLNYNPALTPATFLPPYNGNGTGKGQNITTWQNTGGVDNEELDFTDYGGTLFREPTLLTKPEIPLNSSLQLGPNDAIRSIFGGNLSAFVMNSGAANEGIACLTDPASLGTAVPYIGVYVGQAPVRWIYTTGTGQNMQTRIATAKFLYDSISASNGAGRAVTYRIQYQDANNNWVTYDQKYGYGLNFNGSDQQTGPYIETTATATENEVTIYPYYNAPVSQDGFWESVADPRTARFGLANSWHGGHGSPYAWLDPANDILAASRYLDNGGVNDGGAGIYQEGDSLPYVAGWYPLSSGSAAWLASNGIISYQAGLLTQNNPSASSTKVPYSEYFTDADGVVRTAMAGYVPTNTGIADTQFGLPMTNTVAPVKPGYQDFSGLSYGQPGPPFTNQSQSRPIILHRPFRSVAELGYVFSDIPWRNLSMFTPESGFGGLLDVFCVQDTTAADPLVAGKVNLNTRQQPVLKAILAGAYADEFNAATSTILAANVDSLATALIARTTETPLTNLADILGRWSGRVTASEGGINGRQSYPGFADDIGSVVYTTGTAPGPAIPLAVAMHNIARFREAPIRALTASGTTRVWNLLIDLVAQTGRYPQSATGMANFVVDGEQHYWVHVAIDRYTGAVIDKQVEVVRE